MSVMEGIRRRMFGRPAGLLGRLGGLAVAHVNCAFAHSIVQALQLQPGAKVLEVGFGPG